MNATLGRTKLNKDAVNPVTKNAAQPTLLQFSYGSQLSKTLVGSFSAWEHHKTELGHLKRVVHIQLKVNAVSFKSVVDHPGRASHLIVS